jgi:hypothetical protein
MNINLIISFDYKHTNIKKTSQTTLIVLDLISLHVPTYHLFEYIVIQYYQSKTSNYCITST